MWLRSSKLPLLSMYVTHRMNPACSNVLQPVFRHIHSAICKDLTEGRKVLEGNRTICLICCAKSKNINGRRYFSQLTEFNLMEEPSLGSGFTPFITNWIKLNWIVPRSLDKNFVVKDFLQGSLKAIDVVSKALSEQNFSALDGLLTKECLNRVKEKVNNLSAKRREYLATNENHLGHILIHRATLKNDGE